MSDNEQAKSTEVEKLMVLPAKVLQATLNYLATRPYNEVAALINAVSQAKDLPSDKE